MTPEFHQRVAAVFHAALERPAAERDTFVKEACAGDDTLQAQVERLLARDAEASQERFLGIPDPLAPALPAVEEEPATALVGRRIGAYEVEQFLARGGMGAVYKARHGPLGRLVALKVIRHGSLAEPAERARFRAEAEAAARFSHPNLVQIYDVGEHDGLPYFAMEYLEGGSLAQKLAGTPLLPDQAAELVETLARAVHYAHTRQVVHRDLKPGNVLYAADGTPKLTDFGLAKRLDVEQDQTQTGAILGTPGYMAPEQARGSPERERREAIGPPADVYGLGALLYALLTGRPPFQGPTVMDTVALVTNAEPVSPRQLQPKVPRDLETICLKCLEKEPARRYATAVALADDLRGFLEGRPIVARPVRLPVRGWRWCRRNPGMAGLAASLLIGLITSTALAIWANHSRQQAERAAAAETVAREAAQAREEEIQAVLDFVEKRVFAAARPKGEAGGLGHEVPLRDAVWASLPSLATSFQGQPLVEARLRLTLGNTFSYLGDRAAAAEQDEQAHALYTRHRGPDHPDTLQSMHNLANSYAALNRHAEALKLREEALAARKRVLPPDHPDTLQSMHNLARSYAALNRHGEALRLGEEALAAQKRVLPPNHPDTLISTTSLANSYMALNRYAEALKLYEEALAAFKRVLPPDHPDTLRSMNNLAVTYAALNRHAEALKLGEETLAARKRVLPPDHPETLTSMNNLANRYAALNRHAEALKLVEETLAAQKRVLPPDHPDTLQSMNNLANRYAALNRHAEALKLGEETLAARKRVLSSDHPDTLRSMGNLANRYYALNRHAEALKLGEETLAARKRVLPPDHPDTVQSMYNLANCYAALNRHAEALKLYAETLAAQKRVLPTDHSDTLRSMHNLAVTYATLNRHAEALPLLDECLAKADRPGVHPRLIPSAIGLRLECCQKLSDVAGCRATAQMLEKRKPADAASLYDAACAHAVTAALQAQAKEPDAARLARQDADQAMAWLTKAVAAGYQDAAHMKKDADLAALRDREDFQKLLAELEGKQQGKPKK